MVPPDKVQDFLAKWKDFAAEEVDVDVQAIPLSQLDLGSGPGTLTASELMLLDVLVDGDA